MKAKLLHRLSVLVVIALIAVACGGPATTIIPTESPVSKPRPGGTLRVVTSGNIDHADPALAFNYVDWMITTTQTHQGLMKFDFDDKLKPDLAESYEVSPDGKVFTFKLRQGIKFSNGRELEAADVKYSIERIAQPKTGSWGQSYTANIAGAADVIAGKATALTGIEVPDKYTIKFTLTKPQSTFLSFLAASPFFAVPKEEVEKWGDQFTLHAVGTGPFMIKEWLPGTKLVLAKNPNYWEAGKPYLDAIEYTMNVDAQTALLKVEAGDVDMIADVLPPSVIQQAMSDPKWKDYVYTRSGFTPAWMPMDTAVPPLDNVKVRQAILYAIDVEKLQKLLTGVGEPLFDLFPPGAPGHDPNFRMYKHDPAKAKALLAEAGLADGFQTDFYYTDLQSFIDLIGPPIQQDLAAVGIKLELHKLSGAAYWEKIGAKSAPMFVTTWAPVTMDSTDWIGSIFVCSAKDSATGFASYCNPKVDELFQKTQTTFDEAERAKAFGQIRDLIMADALVLPIVNVQTFVIVSPRVKGYSSHLLVPPINPWVWLEDAK